MEHTFLTNKYLFRTMRFRLHGVKVNLYIKMNKTIKQRKITPFFGQFCHQPIGHMSRDGLVHRLTFSQGDIIMDIAP